MNWAIEAAERGWIPDPAIRLGIRRLLAARLREEKAANEDEQLHRLLSFVDEMGSSPIALVPDTANEQHYEVPAEFFATVLGSHLKYSACVWPDQARDLEEAEEHTLALTCERAGIQPGMEILDLGCGWGSLSLYMARTDPTSRILAVSNSRLQADFIRKRARQEGLGNVEVLTADMNDFDTERRFHRVVSIEMFEHMRNWEALLGRISAWLEPGGAFFLHVFCHRELAYAYEDRGESDWMSRYFFTGGMMPSDLLPLYLDTALSVRYHWRENGNHYSRTLESWLQRMDAHRDALLPLFRRTYGRHAERWFQRWRLFFLACSELFRYRNGEEWWVSHYLWTPRGAAQETREDKQLALAS
jgi:cyclopropane-fatty-acyl-phospholipid synthase